MRFSIYVNTVRHQCLNTDNAISLAGLVNSRFFDTVKTGLPSSPGCGESMQRHDRSSLFNDVTHILMLGYS